jgi:hypothetical protein
MSIRRGNSYPDKGPKTGYGIRGSKWTGNRPPPVLQVDPVVVSGGRDFTDRDLLFAKLDRLTFWLDNPVLVVGDCPSGADVLAVEWAEWNWYDRVIFRADWNEHGKAAGMRRNAEMVRYAAENGCQVFVAFWDGRSPGTDHCIEVAKKWIPAWGIKIVRYS